MLLIVEVVFFSLSDFSLNQDRLTGLLKWYKSEGLVPKEKKSGDRQNNTKALSFDDTKHVVRFLTNYAATHALNLNGLREKDIS